jgi:hypothetical protein
MIGGAVVLKLAAPVAHPSDLGQTLGPNGLFEIADGRKAVAKARRFATSYRPSQGRDSPDV